MLNQAAVTCQRMSAHHDSATFLAAAHVLPVPDQQAAVDGTCVLTLFTLMGRICLLNWTVSGCIFPPSQLFTASDKSPLGRQLRAGSSFQFTWI